MRCDCAYLCKIDRPYWAVQFKQKASPKIDQDLQPFQSLNGYQSKEKVGEFLRDLIVETEK